jgi:hypothetical protein
MSKRRFWVGLSLDNTVPPGKVESTTNVLPLQVEENLSYDQVLDGAA